ncbi:MAG: hypothetical protein HQ564_05430 [Candidatus Saganbacteria bacterium]|nr:hypothetical protein [Candidatus Saganbacteria bacterium]
MAIRINLSRVRVAEPLRLSSFSLPAKKPLPPSSLLFRTGVGSGCSVEYSRQEFDDLLFGMRGRTVEFVSRLVGIENRLSHPDIPGVEVFYRLDLSSKNPENSGRATWRAACDKSDTVVIDEGYFALIDLENASSNLMVGYKQAESTPGVIIKGKQNGREKILICQERRCTGRVLKWIKKQGFEVDQIVLTTGWGGEIKPEIEEAFADYPTAVVNSWGNYRGYSVMVGGDGFHLVSDLENKTKRFRWDGMEKIASHMERRDGFSSVVKDAVEGLFFEYGSQNGGRTFSTGELLQVFENIRRDKTFQYLSKKFFEEEPTGEQLKLWVNLITIFAAKAAMPIIAPRVLNPDPKVTLYRSYYYALSWVSRLVDHRSEMKDFFRAQLKELKTANYLDETDCDFLLAANSCFPSCWSHSDEGIGDHDTHNCINEYFSRYSPFPFQFLADRISLLSIVGGYQRKQDVVLCYLLNKIGWHELVVSEFMRGRGRWKPIGFYGKAARLVDKYGFEMFGKMARFYKEKGMSDAAKMLENLIPAINHLVTKRADLDVDLDQALIHRFVETYNALIAGGPEGVSEVLKPLSKFIAKAEELDPKQKGALGYYLVQISKAYSADGDIEDLFMFAIPGLAHLINSLDELDPTEPDSFASFIVSDKPFLNSVNSILTEGPCWSGIYRLLPYIKSKEELVELDQNLAFWDNHRDNFSNMFKLLDNRALIGSVLSKDELSLLILEILNSKTPTYITVLKGILGSPSFGKNRYQFVRKFIFNKEIDFKIRMKVLMDYAEVVQLDELLLPKKESGTRFERLEDGDKIKQQIKVFDVLVCELDQILEEISQSDQKLKAKVRRLQAKLGKKLMPFRRKLIAEVLGRPIKRRERKLLDNGVSYNRILRLVSLVLTIDRGGGFDQGGFSRVFLKKVLGVFFANFFPGNFSTLKKAEENAIRVLNNWLCSLSKDEIEKMYQEHYETDEGRREYNKSTEHVRGNAEIRAALMANGYKDALWGEGVGIQAELKDGLTQEDKRRQIISATGELVEIAMMLGIEEIDSEKLTLHYAKRLDSYKKASDFAAHIKNSVDSISDEVKGNIRYILENVSDFEKQRVQKNAKAAIFRATVKKDLFVEAYSGVGVPGCFNPRGIHREMPFVHAAEANSGFLQVFSKKNNQVANAVVLYEDEGAFVYAGYNSSGYNMEAIFAEALKELSKLVPAIYLKSSSAGFGFLKDYASRVKKKVVKPQQYFAVSMLIVVK